MDERARIEQEIRAKAKRRVGAKLGFYWHLLSFTLINAGLAGVNLSQGADYLWFLWPLTGWSIGLALHGFATFQLSGMSEAMVEAEVRRELERRGLAPSA